MCQIRRSSLFLSEFRISSARLFRPTELPSLCHPFKPKCEAIGRHAPYLAYPQPRPTNRLYEPRLLRRTSDQQIYRDDCKCAVSCITAGTYRRIFALLNLTHCAPVHSASADIFRYFCSAPTFLVSLVPVETSIRLRIDTPLGYFHPSTMSKRLYRSQRIILIARATGTGSVISQSQIAHAANPTQTQSYWLQSSYCRTSNSTFPET